MILKNLINFIEEQADLLESKLLLFELADKRKDALQYMRSLSFTFSEHICKLLIWGTINKNWDKDWSDEIFDKLRLISAISLKGGKELKDKDYLDFFFMPYLETVNEMDNMLKSTYQTFMEKESYPCIEIPEAFFSHTIYLSFVDEILPILHTDEFTYNSVTKLIKKYFL